MDLFIEHVAQLRYLSTTADKPFVLDRRVVLDTLVWIIYEASFKHSIYHIAPRSTYLEHLEVRSGISFEDRSATPEAVTSLYPSKLDTVGSFKLDPTSINVLRDALYTRLTPFMKDVMKTPATIITTHAH